jgi:N12 class adenine-specific DNA methylase
LEQVGEEYFYVKKESNRRLEKILNQELQNFVLFKYYGDQIKNYELLWGM